jgi:hypothetical protein
MTETAVPSRPARTERPRPSRRGPSELPIAFVERALVERLANDGAEPAWLRSDRLAALERYEALPVEANQLYTPYLDLRGADLMDAVPYGTSAAAMPSATSARVPADVAGLIELREDGVAAHAVAPDVAAAGVVLETFAQACAVIQMVSRPGSRAAHLPDDETSAHRAAWARRRIVVPDGWRSAPVLVRWLTESRTSPPDGRSSRSAKLRA